LNFKGLLVVQNDKQRLLTPAQVAEFYRVSVDTLAQWRSQRRGPRYIKIGNRLIRYRLSDLEMYLAAHSVEDRPV
jgi:predicted DNA-binding transcriptional regulator AlpA